GAGGNAAPCPGKQGALQPMATTETAAQGPSPAQSDRSSSKERASVLDSASKLIQVLSVVVGVIISVLSFNAARETEARARVAEAEARKLELKRYDDQRKDESEKRQAEAARPFLELRQKLYLEAVQAAAILANPNPNDHSKEKFKEAKTRFRELYVGEL